jgi:membrane dipeptidase
MSEAAEQRVVRLHSQGLVDMHFDLPMELYERRREPGLLAREFIPEFKAGDMGVVAAAIFIEDRYVPDQALSVALGQVARLYNEAVASGEAVVCRSYGEITAARAAGLLALVLTMEGVEPIGTDLNLLRVFYELGVRVVGLTHARRNAAACGGIFAANGSPSEGLSAFGRDVVAECQKLGIILDLAHINAAGFDDVLAGTAGPVIVSHTNSRRYYDIERNISDAQVRMIGERGGVIGVNSVLVSPKKEEATVDRYVDHIQHIIDLIGIDGVAIGFDFFEFIYRQWPEDRQQTLRSKLAQPHFPPGLVNHSHARNLTRRLIERDFSDEQIEKILFRNWMRILETLK